MTNQRELSFPAKHTNIMPSDEAAAILRWRSSYFLLRASRLRRSPRDTLTTMTTKKLREIIELGETDTVEFKRRFSDFEKIAKEMIALANTRGGLLLFGIDDDGTIVGVASEKSEIELITSAAEFYSDPPIDIEIEIIDIEGVDVVAVYISESPNKPHRLVTQTPPANGNGNGSANSSAPRVYIRQGDRSVLASKEVARVLAASSRDAPPLRIEIGNIERTLFDFLERNGRVTLREFRHLVNISERRASRTLVRLVQAGLIRIFTNEREDYYTLS
jgi:predicted HTH transcriptional regulator